MKIGIISMQRVSNYGSFLQAYGLKNLIESLGHVVTFVDYRCGKPVVQYSPKSRAWMYVKIYAPLLIKAFDYFRYYVLRKTDFNIVYRIKYLPELGISYRYNFNEDIDIAVVGSDEVFNCLQAGTNVGFSPMLFGQNINSRKVISYAASCGYTNLLGISRYGLTQKLGGYFNSFAALSVRDENTRYVIKELTGIEPELNLDPVLVSDFKLPKRCVQLQNYVVLYTYGTRTYSESEQRDIKNFCKENGKMLISIGQAQSWVDRKIQADPFEMLSYIKDADFIITDTFHGTIFSIKYNKNFVTRIRPDNEQKLRDLLKRLEMDSRRITDYSQLQEIYDSMPDYHKTNEIIYKERQRTMDYLRNHLC